ncbi:unnamed protein product [Brassicogethes aeneus]|uniref:Uncharacterized protein n=1 Tax=Brassicogethes aeneus TaxID=1431903 RepID=A0A9P0AX12_BRAAE|nr:unnamed protein product [Brassicogethes aeneus]
MVPNIKETYENLNLLFDLVKINKISFKFLSDFKIILMVNGLQTATSSYPCPYCCISLKELRSYSEYHKELRSYGDNTLHFNKFDLIFEKKLKRGNESFSTINKAIFKEEDDVKIFKKCIIPELYLLQRFINHLFFKGLLPLLGKENALKCPKQLHLVTKNYQGELFEGNACRKWLKNAEDLKSKGILVNLEEVYGIPFVVAFNTMNRIVEKCFGSKLLCTLSKLKADMSLLKAVLKGAGVSQTLWSIL